MKKITENNLWAFAFLLVSSAYFAGLFVDLTGDSGLYAAISRQMVDSGDWFNLKINDKLYDQKPHLFFWLAGLGIQFFGNTNFAFKLFPFIYGAAGIYFTYRLGTQLFSKEVGKWAAFITGTSQIYFLYFFDFHTDSVLQTGVVLALWQLAAHLQHKKWSNFVFGFLGVGLAMLSKGPVGSVLPFFAVLLYLIFQKDFRQLFHPKWFLGIFISIVVISPTLIHLYNSFGVDGIKFFFITNNFGRITGEYAGSSTDYFFYIHTLLWAFLPWTIVVLFALYSTIRKWFLPEENTWNFYLLGSVFVLLLILSVAKGKAPNYFLIAVAPISVIAGKWLAHFNSIQVKSQRVFILLQMCFTALLIVFAVFIILVFSDISLLTTVILMLIIILLIFILVKFKLQQMRKVILISTIITGMFNLFLNVSVFPDLYSYQGARQVLKLYEKQNPQETQLYNFELEEYGLFFYSRQPVENIDNWDTLYNRMSKPGTWLYTNEIKYNDIILKDYDIDTVYQIRQRGMNRISLEFINPKTREQSLKPNYLIVTGGKNR